MMSPHDLLSDYDPENEPDTLTRRQKRRAKKAAEKRAKLAARAAERNRLKQLHRNPPSGRAFAVVIGGLFALILLGWWVPQLVGSPEKEPATLLTHGQESSAAPTPTPTDAEISATAAAGLPTEPEVDRSNAESVARGWLTAYLARPSSSWKDWEIWVDPYTMPTVLNQVRGQQFQDPSVLAGKTPTTVSGIRVTDPEADAETNTPIRWSHNLVADVKVADGSTVTITYGLVLADSADGWVVTSVSEVAVSGL